MRLSFFVPSVVYPQTSAEIVSIMTLASAAAELGYQSAAVFYSQWWQSLNPLQLICSQGPSPAQHSLTRQYLLAEGVKQISLPKPPLVKRLGLHDKYIAEYQLPASVYPVTDVFFSDNASFVQGALRRGMNSVYICQGEDPVETFPPDFAESPMLLQVVTEVPSRAEVLTKLGIAPELILTLESGVNSLFSGRDQVNLEFWQNRLTAIFGDRPVLVYAGALKDFKGAGLLLETSAQMPDFGFVVAATKKQDMLRWQKRFSNKNIYWAHSLPQADLRSIFQLATLCVYPHLITPDSFKTSPLKFFEYLCSGTPLVCSKIASLSHFFQHNELDIEWFQPDTSNDLAQAIRRALNRFSGAKPSHGNIEFVLRSYTAKNRLQKIMEAIALRF